MNFELDSGYLEIQQQAREFAQSIEHIAAEADEMSEVHPGLLSALRESGLSRLMVPAEFGGLSATLDPVAICVVREVLMATSCQADSLFAMQGIGSFALSIGGSEAQKKDWLPRIASAECLPAFALTEPASGSDLKSITSELIADGDGWRRVDPGCQRPRRWSWRQRRELCPGERRHADLSAHAGRDQRGQHHGDECDVGWDAEGRAPGWALRRQHGL